MRFGRSGVDRNLRDALERLALYFSSVARGACDGSLADPNGTAPKPGCEGHLDLWGSLSDFGPRHVQFVCESGHGLGSG